MIFPAVVIDPPVTPPTQVLNANPLLLGFSPKVFVKKLDPVIRLVLAKYDGEDPVCAASNISNVYTCPDVIFSGVVKTKSQITLFAFGKATDCVDSLVPALPVPAYIFNVPFLVGLFPPAD